MAFVSYRKLLEWRVKVNEKKVGVAGCLSLCAWRMADRKETVVCRQGAVQTVG